jgi:hypothetical protein
MSKYQVKKRLELKFLGEGWEEAYIIYNAPSYGEIKEFIKKSKVEVGKENTPEVIQENQAAVLDEGIDLLEELFIEGKAFTGNNLEVMKKEDIEDLPVEVINQSFTLLTEGAKSPNL